MHPRELGRAQGDALGVATEPCPAPVEEAVQVVDRKVHGLASMGWNGEDSAPGGRAGATRRLDATERRAQLFGFGLWSVLARHVGDDGGERAVA